MAAALALGPKALMPAASSISANPSTKGPSGPITTKPTFSVAASATKATKSSTPISTQRATLAIPAFPGAQITSVHLVDLAIAQHKECSRPPDPTTNTFMPHS